MYLTLKQMVVCDAWKVRLDFSTIETKEFKNLILVNNLWKKVKNILDLY